jgi:hypothetical protein
MTLTKTVAANILVPVITAASIATFLWLHPAPVPEPVKAPEPPRESLTSLTNRLLGGNHAQDAEWKAWMRCIDNRFCDKLMDTRKADERKRELDRLRMRPLDPTGNRVVPRPRWDWKQT